MSTDDKTCPRCGGTADRARKGAGFPRPGALSRWDNHTEVCSKCGSDEALIAWAAGSPQAAQRALNPVLGAQTWARIPDSEVTL